MGLGKTFVGSEKLMRIGNRLNLVVCQCSKVQDWIEHFQTYYTRNCVFDLTEKKTLEFFMEQAKAEVPSLMIGVINYDLIFRRPVFKSLKNFTLMLDESSVIQNETAKRSKFILGLEPDAVILLSGTPTAGKYENLWSQIHLLGWHIDKKRYWQHYVELNWIEDSDSGFKHPLVVGYKNVDRLKTKLAEHGAIFMKSDEAFTLPEQKEIQIFVPISKKYRRFMSKLLVNVKHLCVHVSGMEYGQEVELIGDTTLTKRLYARQLCGMFSKAKIDAFKDLINSTDDRLIVFYNFNEELTVLHEIALQKTPNVSVVNGSRKDLQAYFLYDDSITFIQYQAGAMGLNLQKANKVVYFTPPERSELFEQSKKRIHRIGQEQTCFYYHLICKGSVEEDIHANLLQRKDYTDELFKAYIPNA